MGFENFATIITALMRPIKLKQWDCRQIQIINNKNIYKLKI